VGLLWSMKPALGQRHGYLLMHDVDKPLRIRLDIIPGFHDVISVDHVITLRDVSVGHAHFERWFKTPDVEEIDIRSGHLRARFFLPPGQWLALASE